MCWEGQERQPRSHLRTQEKKTRGHNYILVSHSLSQKSVCSCMVLREVLIKGRRILTHVKQRSIFSTIISNSWWFDNVTIHIVTIHYFLREESQAEANRLTASYHESHKAVSHSLLFVLLFIFIHPYKEAVLPPALKRHPCLCTQQQKVKTVSENVYHIK